MSRYKLVVGRFLLIFLNMYLLSGALIAAEIVPQGKGLDSQGTTSGESATNFDVIKIEDLVCAPVAYGGRVYCYSEPAHTLHVVAGDPTRVQDSIDTPKNNGLRPIGDNLVLAHLADGILLLLDPNKKKAVKIFGGIHNNSPRETPTLLELDNYQFAFSRKEMVLEVSVKYDGQTWEPVRLSASSRLKASVSLGASTYSVCRNKLCIKKEGALLSDAPLEIDLGGGPQLPVIISETKKLLAIVLRSDAKVAIFDAETNKVITKIDVGTLALPPVVVGNLLYVSCLGDKLLRIFDLAMILGDRL